MTEETPSVAVVLVLHQHPNASPRHPITNIGTGCHVLFPYHGEEEGAGAVHNGNVWKGPITIVAPERLDHQEEERVAWSRAHRIV